MISHKNVVGPGSVRSPSQVSEKNAVRTCGVIVASLVTNKLVIASAVLSARLDSHKQVSVSVFAVETRLVAHYDVVVSGSIGRSSPIAQVDVV